MKNTLALFTALSLFACAPAPVIQTPATPVQEPAKAVDQVVQTSLYEITLPSTWSTRVDNAGDLIAAANTRPNVVVAVNSAKLEDVDDEDFHRLVLSRQSQSKNVRIIEAKELLHSGQRASAAIVVVDGDVVLIQLAVAKDRVGFVMQCGGEVSDVTHVVRTCRDIVGSFRLK